MPATVNKAVSVLSGGLDSTVATLLAAREYTIALALTFDYGQRAAQREIQAAQSFCKRHSMEHRVIELPWLASFTKTALVNRQQLIPSVTVKELERNRTVKVAWAKAVWVPNRNSIFLSIAAAAAESLSAKAIVVGFNAEEGVTFPDNTPAFADAFTTTLRYSTLNHPRVISPTMNMNKTDIMRSAMKLGLDPSSVWSCYEGGDKPCGVCESCVRTKRALQTL